jgi:hypothetical protein
MKIFFSLILALVIFCIPFSLSIRNFEMNSFSAEAVNLTHDYQNPLSVNSFTDWFGNLLISIQGIVGWLAVIMIIIGGLVYMTSGGSQTQATKGKAIVIASLIGFAVAVAAPSLLKEIRDLAAAGAGGGAPTVIASAKTIQEIVTDVMSFLLTLVGVLALISFIYGGFTFIASGGDQNRADNGRAIVTYSIIAVCVSGASLIILRQVLQVLS